MNNGDGGVGLGQLIRLTTGRTVVTTSLRWLQFFLPTLAIAFATSTTSLTTVLGLAEIFGLSTLLLGRHLDGGRERTLLLGSLGLVAVSTFIALAGNFWVFAVAAVGLTMGQQFFTVSGHAFLSRRVKFSQRARTIGIFETSWALALLIGAPIIAVLINWFGWRAPFITLGVLSVLAALLIAKGADYSVPMADATAPVVRQRLTTDAWIFIGASAATGMTGLTTIVIAGTWLDESLDVSTGGVGLVAMAFGAAELSASASSAAVADRAGPIRSTRLALVIAIVGLVIMTQAGSSLLVGALGLLFFFVGFEFSIVTSISIVSEAMPQARGRVLASNTAIGTIGRGVGIILSGVLYESFGIKGPAIVSIVAAITAIALLTAGQRRAKKATTT